MDLYSTLGYGFGMYFMFAYALSILTVFILSILYLFPFIQAGITSERTKWLKRYFKENSSSGQIEDDIRANMLEAAKPAQAHPTYKLLKFYLFSVGIIGIVLGFLIIVLPDRPSGGWSKFLVFIPILVGIGVYFLGKIVYTNQGLWRELAGAFLFLGFGGTAMGAYEVFELDDWLRGDILLYIVLTFGAWVVFHLKSVVASFIYMLIISSACHFVVDVIPYDGYFITSYLIWIYAAVMLYFWIPRLYDVKDIGFKEVVFGILLTSNAFSLVVYNTSGLIIPGLAVMLPTLYLFSKAYYKKASWFGGRPIEVVVIVISILSMLALSIPEMVEMANDSISLFENYSFHKQIAYFILVIIAVCGFILYQDHSDEEQKSVNLLMVFYPLGAFLLIYIVGDYGTQFLVDLFLIYLGCMYLINGTKSKDVIQIAVAVFAIITGLLIRLEGFYQELDSKELIGLIVLFLGAVFLGLGYFIRSKWPLTVNGPGSVNPMRKIESEFEDID